MSFNKDNKEMRPQDDEVERQLHQLGALPAEKKRGKVRLNADAVITVVLIAAIIVAAVLIARDIIGKKDGAPVIRDMGNYYTAVPQGAESGGSYATDAQATPAPLRPVSAGEGLLPVFYRANTGERKIAVTVSGNLNEGQLIRLTDAAQQVGARLTFFPTGEGVEKNVDAWKMVNLLGHEIESSGYRGKRFLDMSSEEEMSAELDSAVQALRDWIYADYQPHFIRTNDMYDDEYLPLHRLLKQHGFYGIARQSVQLSRQVTDEEIQSGVIVNMEIGSLSVDDLCRYLIHLHNDLGFEIVSLNELFEYPPNYISNAGDEE